MKTNVVMIRKMGGLDVSQRTQDGMFNSTELLSQWNKLHGYKKEIKHFLENDSTNAFIDVLVSEEKLEGRNSTLRSVKGGNKGGSTWMHPYLFVKFAMWINPTFEYHVVKFVSDELLKQRALAGDNYIILSNSGSKLKGYDYVEVAKAMQWIVYNKTGKDLRQHATQEQLTDLNDLQSKLAFAIDMGYIKDYTQLLVELRKIYNNKNKKF